MSKIKVTLPDGSSKEYPKGITAQKIAQGIGENLARDALAAKVDDIVVDLSRPINKDSALQILTFRDPEGQEVFRHSASHLMASAVKRIFPRAKVTIGPAIDDGFYYDFDVDKPFTQEDLDKIEGEMKKIVKESADYKRIEISSKEAIKLFKEKGEDYKVELIQDLGDEELSLYEHGDFVDLCRGPHISNTGKIKAFKLTKIAGAYWRGNSENKQLQRIYGVAFPDKKELKDYLKVLEEAEKRDHRKIGRRLDLFSFHPEAPGMPFFHDKGTVIYNELENFMRAEMIKRNYLETRTPIILNKILWEKSGHWNHYKDNMYFTKIDEKINAVKPMNCPGNLLVYKYNVHSYKQLPLRMGEFGLVHRHELGGVITGLFRVRCFTQDDAHLFCTEDQLESEVKELMDFFDLIYRTFGLEYSVELSTKPEKSMGTKKTWDKAETALKAVLDQAGSKYKVNEGDGAFYGPKIDFHIRDALSRTWQCGTIQIDFSMPEKFELEYEGSDGSKHRPVMIHRAIYGSFERFIGILIEHFAGRFPLWFSPIQARVINITDRNIKFSEKLKDKIKESGIRIDSDYRSATVNYKIRDAQMQQVNYILVVGDKEMENNTINVRTRTGKIIGELKVEDLISILKKEINSKALN